MSPRAERWLGAALCGALAGLLLVIVATWATGCGWLSQRDPAAVAYGAERMRCVTDHDAAAEARACMAAVDARYAPLREGGRP